ncbi:lamin tail domain-containing protein [Candidatus Peregrinibacteria bacterium]|nr:MAG: lamin tail domain-containing protein [Candidatus Peregrinibacteria bacterium]
MKKICAGVLLLIHMTLLPVYGQELAIEGNETSPENGLENSLPADPIPDPILEPTDELPIEPVLEPAPDPIPDPILPPADPAGEAPIDPIDPADPTDPIDPPEMNPPLPLPEEPAVESPDPLPTPTTLQINEVMIGSEKNPEKDVWIELYNPTDDEILLDGWQIRGVTSGGRWIDVVTEPNRAVQAKSYFLLSHYTNSSASALSVVPQVNRSSIIITGPDVQIELKAPDETVVDVAQWTHQASAPFESYEKNLEGLWIRSTARVNIKSDCLNTWATPGAPNSDQLTPNEPLPDEASVPARVVINEIAPNPKGGDTLNEFVELWNRGGQAIDLFGWELDDENQEDDQSYLFVDEAKNYVIEPGGYLTLYRSETQLSLGNLGDGLYLYDLDGNEIDVYSFAPDLEGRSWGRNPNQIDEWLLFNHPTPNALNEEINHEPIPIITVQGGSYYLAINLTAQDTIDPDGDALTYRWEFEPEVFDDRENPLTYNYAEPGEKTITLTVQDEYGASAQTEYRFVATSPPGRKHVEDEAPVAFFEKTGEIPSHLISEIMPNPVGNDQVGEWIELANLSERPVDLSGWYLDDQEGKSAPFHLVKGTILSPGEHRVFRAPQLNLSLKNSEDVVRLLAPDQSAQEIVQFSEVKEGWTYAYDSVSNTYQWTPLVTEGQMNRFPPPPQSFQKGDVVLTKLLPNPDGEDEGKEKIILKNQSSNRVALAQWTLRNAKQKTYYLPDLSIESGQTLTLNPADFGLSLVNKSDHIQLIDPAGNEIDSLKWFNAPSGQYVWRASLFQDGMQAVVKRVIDGDTLVIDWEGQPITVRLIGVDTPETVHPKKPVEAFGKMASYYTNHLLLEKTVRLDFEPSKTDRYNRLLAYVYVNDLFVNAHLIEEGYGYAYTRFKFKYRSEFVELEKQAKADGKGLWRIPIVADEVEQQKEREEALEDEDEARDDEPTEEEIAFVSDEPDDILKKVEKDRGDLSETCDVEGLLIQSIVPKGQKGITEESIRIINPTDKTICLNGWQLDDELGSGSRPYSLKGGGIAAGAVRTFFRSETKLALNDSFDCATLINPKGRVIDQLCYQKTLTNQIMTHEGAYCLAPLCLIKEKSTAKKKTKTAAKKVKWIGATIDYRLELSDKTYQANLGVIDPLGHSLQLILPNQEVKTVYYDDQQIDLTELKRLANEHAVIIAALRSDQLVAVQIKPCRAPPQKIPGRSR